MPNVGTRPQVVPFAEYRDALVEFISSQNPTHFVTLAFNRDIKLQPAIVSFKTFHAWMDRRTLGKRWHKRPDQRCSYIAVVENEESNLHIHAAFVVASENRDHFSQVARRTWQKLVPDGDADVREIYEVDRFAEYITKQMMPTRSDRLIISEAFS